MLNKYFCFLLMTLDGKFIQTKKGITLWYIYIYIAFLKISVPEM